jgi:membrane-associated protein
MIDLIRDIFSFADPDKLAAFVGEHGLWVYAVLFAIIFVETGVVVMPFLPGDSLLFAIGAVAAIGKMNFWTVCAVLIVAAILGDAVNYHIGKFIGPRVFNKSLDPNIKPTLIERMLNRKHLERASRFYEKYGGKAVVLGRFVPIVRTFVPFVAGAGAMNYGRFFYYNVVGGVAWVLICAGAGYLFGNMPIVKKHFELVVLGIVAVSVLPIGVEWIRSRRVKAAPAI